MPGVDSVPYLTNSSMMGVDFVPRHLIVVGGSYVGLEFGQMFRRFGSQVTIIEKGARLVSREDKDVSAGIREILEAEGITVRLNANCIGLHRRATMLRLTRNARKASLRSSGRTCCWRWGGVPIRTISDSTKQG